MLLHSCYVPFPAFLFGFLACFLGSSSSVRASQLFNARGKKLVAVSTVSKSTQTNMSSASSMASVHKIQSKVHHQEVASGAVAGAANADAGERHVKADRTLFQRLFQR